MKGVIEGDWLLPTLPGVTDESAGTWVERIDPRWLGQVNFNYKCQLPSPR